MTRYYKLLSVLMAVVLLLTLAACKSATDNPGVSIPDGTTTDPTGTGTGNTTGTTEPTIIVTGTTSAPLQINPITGVADMNGSTLSRPVGIMVANNDFIQSEQVGISSADMWVEAETEGGITRLMAVYANSQRVPASIGPVRSARTPFAKVVEALGLAYAHAGGSYTALDYIAGSDIADLDVNSDDEVGTYSWRDSDYPHDYEYRLRTSGSKLTQYMNDRGYSFAATKDIPWTFGEQKGAPAQNISVRMSGSQLIGFTYDNAANVYFKTNGYSETVHQDISGTAITPNTVLVLYTDDYWETDTTIDFYLQSGEGYVFSNGVMRRFNWYRDSDGFTMTEEDGSTLTIAEGKVYMCVVSSDYEYEISF